MSAKTAEKIAVCFVSPKAYPLFRPDVEGVIGGAEVDLYLLSTELAKDNRFNVSCITADYGQKHEETIENVKVIKSLNFKQNPLTGAIKIWKAMKKANADIYMLESASPGVPLAAAFCKLNKKKFVYRTAHQRECEGDYLREHFLLGKAFVKSLQKAAVITQNDQDRDNLKKTTGLDSVVIRNAHKLPDISDADRKFVLWVGRSAEFKKPQRFLDLASRFPDEHFTMICQQATGDSCYDDLVSSAKKIENLEFIKRVSFNRIDEYFQKAKVYVSTSDSEGFPNTFIQSAKAATAILSYKVNPDDFLGKYNCGLVCNGDMTKLEDLLSSMLKDQTFSNFGANGRTYAEKNHDISKIIKEYKSVFEREMPCQ